VLGQNGRRGGNFWQDTNTLYVFFSTNTFWTCSDAATGGCFGRTHDVDACCARVALGGVALRLTPTFPNASTLPAPSFEQRIANGTLFWRQPTHGGGAVTATVNVHPGADVAVFNVTYAPGGPADPPALALRVSTWVGAVAGKQAYNDAAPRASAAGCADGATGAAGAPCAAGGLVFASRNASTRGATIEPITATLATGARLGPGAAHAAASVVTGPPGPAPWDVYEVALDLVIPGGSWAQVVTVEAESRGAGRPNPADPAPRALAALAAALAAPAAAVPDAGHAWWAAFHGRSSVALPNWPVIEDWYHGTSYLLGGAASTSKDVPAPGLLGNFLTVDGPRWHGDYTLDFDYESSMYGAFASNHGELAEGYWGPIVDWMPNARRKAQVQAAKARITCPNHTLYYACHLAPWGHGVPDLMGTYMHWNGHFAALNFVSHFEYTLNASFAASTILPLLDGLNAWCALSPTADLTRQRPARARAATRARRAAHRRARAHF